MSDPVVGGLDSDDIDGTLTMDRLYDTRGPFETTWKYEFLTHAHHDELQEQAYDEVRENKQNRWNMQGYFTDVPESPVPESSLYRWTDPQSVEYHITTAGNTDGTDRVDFANPYPSEDHSDANISAGFDVGVSANVLPGIGLSASLGTDYSAGSDLTYDQSHTEPHHSYWDIPLTSGYPTDPESAEDATGVSLDVKCYSDHDNIDTETLRTSSQFTFVYWQDVRPIVPVPQYQPFTFTTDEVSTEIDFRVGPP
ncbi:hypothetical protein HLRTI_000615 [Halorhabdus tiamatea SARL4B]|uniref:Uncharacterized protein n=1 Tax=Halorhabdus tiamatea SARL4B TaxID=1033806 RepID=U2DNK1_9EURY|nr:hypothetical protein [Halorhabdus tiamatea]ERJ07257.1 hypothetical protein HLRTI_000615 [Halorhabdus tiamatea SARL4B]